MHQRHHGYNKLRQRTATRTHGTTRKLAKKKHTFCYLLFIDLIICNAVIILIAYVCQYRQCYTYSRITEYCIGFGLLILYCIWSYARSHTLLPLHWLALCLYLPLTRFHLADSIRSHALCFVNAARRWTVIIVYSNVEEDLLDLYAPSHQLQYSLQI